MIANDPIHFPIQYHLPEILHVFSGTNGRIDLGVNSAGRIDVQEQVSNRDFPPEVDVWKHLLHHQSRFKSFTG